MDNPTLFYHYTSVEAFVNIIQSQSLWVSSITEMNDSQEGRIQPSLIRKAIEDAYISPDDTIKCMEKFNAEDPLTQHLRKIPNIEGNPEFIGGLRDITRRALSDLLLPVLEILSDHLLPHVCCFSKHGDKLSQWRAYGDDGKGVALIFTEQGLRDSIEKQNDFPKYIVDVIYDELEQQSYCTKLVEDMIANTIFEKKNTHSPKVQKISKEFLVSSVFFKNKGFQEEGEARLIYNPSNSLGAKFRIVNGNVISYYEHKFKPKNLVGIILGPKCPLRIDTLDFKRFLGSNFNHLLNSIEASTVTYR